MYTRFDRHANMTEDQRHSVLQLIKDIRYADIEADGVFHLENWLYGMFDGYLYVEIPVMATCILPEELAERVVELWNAVDKYPKILDLETIENKIIECLNEADNKLNANDFNRLAESILDYIDEIGRSKR